MRRQTRDFPARTKVSANKASITEHTQMLFATGLKLPTSIAALTMLKNRNTLPKEKKIKQNQLMKSKKGR